jgi:hypothetical protein
VAPGRWFGRGVVISGKADLRCGFICMADTWIQIFELEWGTPPRNGDAEWCRTISKPILPFGECEVVFLVDIRAIPLFSSSRTTGHFG